MKNECLPEMLRAMGRAEHDDLSLAYEAADEIERLRAALMELLWCAEELQETDTCSFLSAITKAKEALNQQKRDSE